MGATATVVDCRTETELVVAPVVVRWDQLGLVLGLCRYWALRPDHSQVLDLSLSRL